MIQEPKFLTSTCPKTGRVFLVKTRGPAFLAEIHPFETLADALEFELNVPIGARYQLGEKFFTLRLIRFFDPPGLPNNQAGADEMARMMRRAIDWYVQAVIKKNSNT